MKKLDVFIAKAKKGDPTLHYKVVVNVIADTALKSSGVKKGVSAADYPKLLKATRKYLGKVLLEDNKARVNAGVEILKICGLEKTKRLTKELNNALSIVGEIKPSP